METKITWSDQMGNRSRRAWLILVTAAAIHSFAGQAIPGVVAVRGTDYTKQGKWSHTTYRLELAPGVRAISGHQGWETDTFGEGLCSAVVSTPTRVDHVDTWADLCTALGVAREVAEPWLRDWKPKAAALLDASEAPV